MIKLWQYQGFRYARVLAVLLISCTLLYVWHNPIDPPNGDTWLGYSLGTLVALLAVFLLLLGAKRRWWIDKLGSQQAWLSMHLWAGMAIIPISLLHSGFQWGWSLHGVLLSLLSAVCVSGLFGVYVYAVHPGQLRQLNSGMGTDALLGALMELDQQIKAAAWELSDQAGISLDSALLHTWLPRGFLDCARGRDRSHLLVPSPQGYVWAPNPQQTRLAQLLFNEPGGAALQPLLARRQQLLATIRKSRLLEAVLGHWLRWHLVLSVAFSALLVVHVVVVLIY
ncbi:hypothetical protein L1F30_11725 [Simiduia sp. 21SJ11W-1]|uniref:hypothetical protein n=1 Tax=Simiduia sp. 21SJ11W-1 TaxID=2909669 RepID=UPI00209D1F10|nr:hypothetical protein [Simiduia sp. 21SJ11W-1]UTA46829.1 hypothetical protein L1F30_11725 [Simiduia sp. 21SJ11W-1]